MAKKKNTNSSERDAETMIRRYMEDQGSAEESIQEDFIETGAQQETKVVLTRGSSRQKQARLSGGDLDATMDAGSSGDETVGGSNPTPDQDTVDELGEAVGLTFENSEELAGEKVYERDTHRWELDPASSEDYSERIQRYR
ncbi:DUF6335 family protein [Candidatus Nitrospira allomarina]|uniref:DUF6335 family protein n=1 Tax=Candidatus Nitrospira allomarina TaxID=3020900 RepID=A0AA96GAS2_9BACT|nr:DUF6335 family protein [Candidatus Nitrospira allomarina]WNM58343.1 DUF6335 family protein [Candidatus Nitrospira allomarina]